MENKIPTAEELILRNLTVYNNQISVENSVKLMIEFAKLHVQAALKEASINAKHLGTSEDSIDEQSILNAYPLDNIK
jgi:hypothetical protein